MLFLLIKFLYIIILSFVYGYTLQQFLQKRVLKNTALQPHFSLTSLSGFFAITVIAAILSLFMPLAGVAHGIVLGGGLLCYLFQRTAIHGQLNTYLTQARMAGRSRQLLFGAAVLFVLYISAQQPFTYDEGLYYAQFIKWMQTYKVVPGLANLHERFGFNSHWHVLAAIFNFSWLTGTSGNQLNGALYLLTVLYLLPSKEEQQFIALLKTGSLLMISMPQFCVYNISAPAADMAIYYICVLVIVCWLEYSAAGQSRLNSNGTIFLLLAPVFLITVKVSAIPILILTVILYWQLLRQQQYAQLLKFCGVAAVMVLPWLIRNVILTGYPLFPMALPDLFHTGWAVPLEMIRTTRQDIHIYAFYRDVDIQRFMAESTLQRYISWFTQYTRIYDKLLILAAAASILPVLIRRKQLPAGFIALYIFLALGTCFWLVQAPDPRFGYSYLAPLVILGAVLCFPKLQLRHIYVPALFLTLLFQIGTIMLDRHLHKVFITEKLIAAAPPHHWWLTPTPYATPAPVAANTTFPAYTTAIGLCWDAPLPCIQFMQKNVKMRGQSLKDGFVSLP